jgi:hypothetical protein
MFQPAECRGAASTPEAEPDTGGGPGCDPAGFGPFSGCGDSAKGGLAGQAFVPDDGVSAEWIAMAARHEAGHVEVARALGWQVESCRLNPDGSGETRVFEGDDPQSLVALKAAGAIAGGTPDGDGNDEADIQSALDDVPPADQDRIEKAGRDEAARIVSARSAQIDRDAAELLKDGDL